MDIEIKDHLYQYLEQKRNISLSEIANTSILTGGVSNKTVLVNFNKKSWVIKQSLQKLRVPGNWECSPERIFREAEAIRWMTEEPSPLSVPKLVFEDKSNYLLAMEAIDPPFQNLKDHFLFQEPEPAYFKQAGRLLGGIQNRAGNGEIPMEFRNNDFFTSLRLDPFYRETARKLPKTSTFYDELIKATLHNQYTIVHGDFSPKNFLVKNKQLVLLDHEVIHFGDGTFDIGFFLAHLFSKANHRPEHKNDFINGAELFVSSFMETVPKFEKEKELRAVNHTIGCLLARVAGLSQMPYLTRKQKDHQMNIGLELLSEAPTSLNQLFLLLNRLLHD